MSTPSPWAAGAAVIAKQAAAHTDRDPVIVETMRQPCQECGGMSSCGFNWVLTRGVLCDDCFDKVEPVHPELRVAR